MATYIDVTVENDSSDSYFGFNVGHSVHREPALGTVHFPPSDDVNWTRFEISDGSYTNGRINFIDAGILLRFTRQFGVDNNLIDRYEPFPREEPGVFQERIRAIDLYLYRVDNSNNSMGEPIVFSSRQMRATDSRQRSSSAFDVGDIAWIEVNLNRFNSAAYRNIEAIFNNNLPNTQRVRLALSRTRGGEFLTTGPGADPAPPSAVGILSTQVLKRFALRRPITKAYIGRATTPYWQHSSPPTINSFTSAPATVDLDTRASGNITLNFSVSNSTQNRIHNKATGANVPLTGNNQAVIAQPAQSTTYVLVCTNRTGSVSQELTVNVTRNPQVNNLRRTGFRQSIHGLNTGTYRFGATIIGLPQPVLTYRFSTGENGTITTRHLTQGARPDTWTLDWTQYFGTSVARSLTVTATNSSGSATGTIQNITAG